MMRDALLRDLSKLEDWRLMTTLDERLDRMESEIECITIAQEQNPWEVWQACMKVADAIWVIAPESNRLLLKMAEMATNTQATWLGPNLDAIAMTSDKYWMAQILAQNGLASIPTYYFAEWSATRNTTWLVKPIDGAGCEATYVLNGAQAVLDWFNQDTSRRKTHIIQPYMAGIPASVSVISLQGQPKVLSCNLQTMLLANGQLHYLGGIINGAADYWALLEDLTRKIVKAIPGLDGYFGVDVLINTETPAEVTIVEINPRLTTTYAYLREATGCNIARWVVDARLGSKVDMPNPIQRNRIEFKIEHAT